MQNPENMAPARLSIVVHPTTDGPFLLRFLVTEAENEEAAMARIHEAVEDYACTSDGQAFMVLTGKPAITWEDLPHIPDWVFHKFGILLAEKIPADRGFDGSVLVTSVPMKDPA